MTGSAENSQSNTASNTPSSAVSNTVSNTAHDTTSTQRSYSFLGPAGTFTEAALAQVPEAEGQDWRPVASVLEALDDVVAERSTAAMIAVENSIEGGVSVSQDALATIPGLRIVGEYLVAVSFVLVARPGIRLEDVRTINAHPVAYAQCRNWLVRNVPGHVHRPAASNVAAAAELFENSEADAALAPPTIAHHHDVTVLARDIVDNSNALTRFALVKKEAAIPAATGADKTTVIVELPDDRPGALLDMLEQFSTRGVNLSLIESRPVGDALGRYRFVIDADGHVFDERVADALMGLHRFSPSVVFLGSYPRADRTPVRFDDRYRDEVFTEARDWLRGIVSGEPND